jgi:hypothetical protein
MLTIIHGNDTVLSRKYFLEEKEKVSQAVLLNSEQVNLTDLAQLFQGGGLFGETKYVFIEQFLTKQKKISNYKEIVNYLENHASENTIVLWEQKELERSTVNSFKKANIKLFNLPQTLFQFLDALKPNNGKILLSLYHKTVKITEPEMIFFMLIRHFRILLSVYKTHSSIYNNTELDGSNQIDEIRRLAPWQKNKLEKQASLFELDQLLTLYEKLFSIESGQKTGTLTAPLVSTIDFFLLEV